jgi:hypothetical protein
MINSQGEIDIGHSTKCAGTVMGLTETYDYKLSDIAL